MKVGDLVELSHKGKEITWCRNFRDCTGIVVDITTRAERLHNVQVMWLGKRKSGTHIEGYSTWVTRKYLKTVSSG